MNYIPDRGHLVWLSFTPQSGHEQAGRRPALVLSPRAYNSKVGLLLACPVTSVRKGYPFEVSLSSELAIQGVILSDQVKSLDWQSRNAEYIADAPTSVFAEVMGKLNTLLQT